MLDIFAIVVFVGYCVLLGMYPIKTIVVSVRTAIAGTVIVMLAMKAFSLA